MANTTGVEIDAEGMRRLLDELRPEHYKRVIRSTLNKQSRKLLKATRANFAHLVGSKHTGGKGALISGASYGAPKDKVGSSKVYAKGNNPYAVVSLRGRRADFRALFFERGTRERKTARGETRGRITAGWYFRRAQQQTKESIFGEMERDMMQVITRKIKSYNK